MNSNPFSILAEEPNDESAPQKTRREKAKRNSNPARRNTQVLDDPAPAPSSDQPAAPEESGNGTFSGAADGSSGYKNHGRKYNSKDNDDERKKEEDEEPKIKYVVASTFFDSSDDDGITITAATAQKQKSIKIPEQYAAIVHEGRQRDPRRAQANDEDGDEDEVFETGFLNTQEAIKNERDQHMAMRQPRGGARGQGYHRGRGGENGRRGRGGYRGGRGGYNESRNQEETENYHPRGRGGYRGGRSGQDDQEENENYHPRGRGGYRGGRSGQDDQEETENYHPRGRGGYRGGRSGQDDQEENENYHPRGRGGYRGGRGGYRGGRNDYNDQEENENYHPRGRGGYRGGGSRGRGNYRGGQNRSTPYNGQFIEEQNFVYRPDQEEQQGQQTQEDVTTNQDQVPYRANNYQQRNYNADEEQNERPRQYRQNYQQDDERRVPRDRRQGNFQRGGYRQQRGGRSNEGKGLGIEDFPRL